MLLKGEIMVDSINNTGNIDYAKWKKLTPQEILKEEGREEIPEEILVWAQQMAAFAKIPDDVTYEQVDGDVGVDALAKLGIEDEPPVAPEDDNAGDEVETEDPDAVRETDRPEAEDDLDDENIFAQKFEDEENFENDDFSLANADLTANQNEIRKRKERKGML